MEVRYLAVTLFSFIRTVKLTLASFMMENVTEMSLD